jgi:hypothetical protein
MENKGGDTGIMSNDIQSSTMCENTTSMCIESIYKNHPKYHLNSNNEFKLLQKVLATADFCCSLVAWKSQLLAEISACCSEVGERRSVL